MYSYHSPAVAYSSTSKGNRDQIPNGRSEASRTGTRVSRPGKQRSRKSPTVVDAERVFTLFLGDCNNIFFPPNKFRVRSSTCAISCNRLCGLIEASQARYHHYAAIKFEILNAVSFDELSGMFHLRQSTCSATPFLTRYSTTIHACAI